MAKAGRKSLFQKLLDFIKSIFGIGKSSLDINSSFNEEKKEQQEETVSTAVVESMTDLETGISNAAKGATEKPVADKNLDAAASESEAAPAAATTEVAPEIIPETGTDILEK